MWWFYLYGILFVKENIITHIKGVSKLTPMSVYDL